MNPSRWYYFQASALAHSQGSGDNWDQDGEYEFRDKKKTLTAAFCLEKCNAWNKI